MNVITTSPMIWITKKEELEDRLDAQGYHPTRIAMISKLESVSKEHGWKITKLKNIANILHPSIDPQMYPDTDFIYIDIGHVSSEDGWAGEQKVKGVELLSQKILFRSGDILFSKIRPYLNKVTLVPKYLKQGLGSSEFFIVRPKQDRNYLWIFLRSELTLRQTVPPFTGSSRPRLRKEDVEDIRVLIPSENFVNKINERVGKAEAFRQRARDLQLELEGLSIKLGLKIPEIKTAISLIVKSEDLISRLDPQFYYYKYVIPKVLQEYPHEIKKLDEVAKLSSERINPNKKPEKKFKYVEIANVNPNWGEIESYKVLLGKDAPSRARMLLRKGNIVLSSLRGSLKAIAIVPQELDKCIGTTGFFVLKPNEEIINKESLWWVLRTDIVQRQLEQMASGAIMAAINKRNVRRLKIPIPPHNIQEEIATKVVEIQKLRREAAEIVRECVMQVEALLTKHEKR